MKEVILAITPELYTIKEAAKKLGSDNNPARFHEEHVVRGGLRYAKRPNGALRISSIELARYIMSLTEE